MQGLDIKIEAILFYKSEPVMVTWLAKTLNAKESEIYDALNILDEKLKERGIKLVRKDNSIRMGTSPDESELIEKIAKEEMNKDLGKAALETLSAILYKGPISKSEIDYIRGVNSNFILRNLLIRGLIEREVNPEDTRSFLYRPTLDLLAYMGATKQEELPQYEHIVCEIEKFKEEFGTMKEGDNYSADENKIKEKDAGK